LRLTAFRFGAAARLVAAFRFGAALRLVAAFRFVAALRLVAAFRFGAALRLVAAFRFVAALRLVAALRFGAALRLVAAFFLRVVVFFFGATLRLVAAFFLRVVVFFFGAALRLTVVFLRAVVFFAVVFLVAFFRVAISNLHCSRIAHDEYKQRFTNYQFFFIELKSLCNDENTLNKSSNNTAHKLFAEACRMQMARHAIVLCLHKQEAQSVRCGSVCERCT
jgi:hypothetical protein